MLKMNFIEKYPVWLLFFIVFLLYFNSLFFDLVYCDDINIIETNYDRIGSIDRLDNEFFSGYLDTDYYRPLVNISFVINASLGGKNPFIYHLTNIILHFLCVYLLFIILLKLKFLLN